MCHLCTSRAAYSQPISRRQFLQAAVATGAGLLLTACGMREEPVLPATGTTAALAATPTLRASISDPLTGGSTPSRPSELPNLAGALSQLSPDSLAVAAPVGERVLAIRPGLQEQLQTVAPRQSVAIWLDEAQQVTVIRPLPPMAATDDIPEGPQQPPATGEWQPFGPLQMITRAGWGAAPGPQWVANGESGPFDPVSNPGGWLVYPEPLAQWFTTLVVHHSALEFYQGPQTIQRLHLGPSRFADVGYHFIVDGLGQLYEGRPLNVRGAHTGGFNTGTVGVCLLGNFEIVRPVKAQLETLRALARYLRQEYTISHLAGHRDFQPDATVCPGDNLHEFLPALAQETSLVWGTSGYVAPSW